MKTILSLLFVVLCLRLGSCDVPGTLVGISRLTSRATPSCLNTITPICKDCNTLLKCLGTDPAPEVNCKTAYPDRPYCSKGACVSTAPSDCKVSFLCTGAGYYPNPLNCSRYHLCAAAGAVGSSFATYECPNGFVYNPATTMCKLSTVCDIVDCSADPNGYARYPADSQFYASCSPGEVPIMIKCPTYYVYKPSANICVFQCPSEGRIAIPNSETKYYDCYLNAEKTLYYYRESECIDGYLFDQNTSRCQPKPA